MRGSIPAFACVVALAILSGAGCTAPYGVRAGLERRTFADPDEAVAWVRSRSDAAIAAVPAAPAPLPAAARVHVPTRALLEEIVVKEMSVRSDWYPRAVVGLGFSTVAPPLKQRVDLLEIDYLALARVIERRRIFARIEIVRADRAETTDAPRGGFVVWIRKRPRENYALAMAAADQGEFTTLPLPRDRRDPAAFLLGHARAVEDFAHRRRLGAP
jgi:hypothetical protein